MSSTRWKWNPWTSAMVIALGLSGILVPTALAQGQRGPTYPFTSKDRVGQRGKYEMKQLIEFVGPWGSLIANVGFRTEETIVSRQDSGSVTVACTLTGIGATMLANNKLQKIPEVYAVEGKTFTLTIGMQGQLASLSCADPAVMEQNLATVRTMMADAYLPISSEPHAVGDTWEAKNDKSYQDSQSGSQGTIQEVRSFVFTKLKREPSSLLAEVKEQSTITMNEVVYMGAMAVQAEGTGKGERTWLVNTTTGRVQSTKFKSTMNITATPLTPGMGNAEPSETTLNISNERKLIE